MATTDHTTVTIDDITNVLTGEGRVRLKTLVGVLVIGDNSPGSTAYKYINRLAKDAADDGVIKRITDDKGTYYTTRDEIGTLVDEMEATLPELAQVDTDAALKPGIKTNYRGKGEKCPGSRRVVTEDALADGLADNSDEVSDIRVECPHCGTIRKPQGSGSGHKLIFRNHTPPTRTNRPKSAFYRADSDGGWTLVTLAQYDEE
jgi:hypothetical protein